MLHLSNKRTESLLQSFRVLVVVLLIPAPLLAGEIEPRSYINTPAGVNFLIFGTAQTRGGLSTAASSPLQDAELEIDTDLLAYAHSFGVMGQSAKVDVILPYSELDGTATFAGAPRERYIADFHDPRFRFSMNFIGAPSLSLEDYRNYQQDLIVGGSIQISAPYGQYDDDRLVNLGANRWFIKPELGVSKAWGPVALELSSGVFLFTDNDEYLGGKKLEQDPLYTGQVHLTYSFTKGMWFALSATSDLGGRTTVNSIENDDEQDNSRAGATFALSLNKNHSVKLFASEALHTRAGTDYDLVGVAWQYRWGGGL